jgi:hypothetical protein
MARLTSRLVSEFSSRRNNLEQTRGKMENLLATGQIGTNDIEQVYTGLYLDIFTEFESSLEALFLGLLSGTFYSKAVIIQRRARIQPVTMTRQVVFGVKSYLDWLPYKEHTVRMAKNFFVDGKPFTLLADNQVSELDDYCVIRNAIAHKSESANTKFQTMIAGLPLLPSEKSPAGYLRSRPYASMPVQTQYEIAVLELEDMLRTICL